MMPSSLMLRTALALALGYHPAPESFIVGQYGELT